MFKKNVRVGTIPSCGGRRMSVFLFIKVTEGRLTISGVEGPLPSGNAIGSCGQIDMHLTGDEEWHFAPGWSQDLLKQTLAVWGEWHLNDMQAGSPRQREYLEQNGEGLKDYTAKLKALESAGLSPDAEYLHKGKPYVYGSAWLEKALPQSVAEFLVSLPEADQPVPGTWGRG